MSMGMLQHLFLKSFLIASFVFHFTGPIASASENESVEWDQDLSGAEIAAASEPDVSCYVTDISVPGHMRLSHENHPAFVEANRQKLSQYLKSCPDGMNLDYTPLMNGAPPFEKMEVGTTFEEPKSNGLKHKQAVWKSCSYFVKSVFVPKNDVTKAMTEVFGRLMTIEPRWFITCDVYWPYRAKTPKR